MKTHHHPALASIVVEVIDKDGYCIARNVVDHNTSEGRLETAMMARAALVAGNVCITRRSDTKIVFVKERETKQ